jgi:hypothetical protein
MNHRTSAIARALAALALLAMSVRALVPAGFMPAQQDGRFLSVVLCTGYGGVEAVLDLATGDVSKDAPAHDGSRDEETPCVFAAAAPLAPPSASSILISAPLVVGESDAAPAQLAFMPGLAAPPPWATAPPQA